MPRTTTRRSNRSAAPKRDKISIAMEAAHNDAMLDVDIDLATMGLDAEDREAAKAYGYKIFKDVALELAQLGAERESTAIVLAAAASYAKAMWKAFDHHAGHDRVVSGIHAESMKSLTRALRDINV